MEGGIGPDSYPPIGPIGSGIGLELPRNRCKIVDKRAINVPGPCIRPPSESLAADSDPLAGGGGGADLMMEEQGEDEDEVEEDRDGEQEEDKEEERDSTTFLGDLHSKHHRKGRKSSSHKNKHHHHHHHHHAGRQWANKCVAKGSFCGGNLFGCEFDSGTLYRCDAVGAAPQPVESCYASVCLTGASFGTDVCYTEPIDTETTTSRLWRFIPGKLWASADTLYSCEKTGAKSKPSKHCPHGCKVVANDGDVCVPETPLPDTCKCPGSSNYCGRELNPACGADLNSVYLCFAGEGTKPVLARTCRDDREECGRNDKWGGATCIDKFEGTCHCEYEGTYCGGELDSVNCRELIDKNGPRAIYTCDDTPGAAYKLNDMCPEDPVCRRRPVAMRMWVLGQRLRRNSSASSTSLEPLPDLCKCPGSSMYCGREFDPACEAEENSVYDCIAGERTEPVLAASCRDNREQCGRRDKWDAATCMDKFEGTCHCSYPGTYCGGDMDAFYCRELIDKNGPRAIYTCDDTPASEYKLTEMCPENAVCGHRPVAIESVGSVAVLKAECIKSTSEETPNCRCGDKSGNVCGSSFHVACGFDNTRLYACLLKGQIPRAMEMCGLGCDISVFPNACARDSTTTDPTVVTTTTATDDPLPTTPITTPENVPEIKTDTTTSTVTTDPLTTTTPPETVPPTTITTAPETDAPPATTAETPTPNLDCTCKGTYDMCGNRFPTECHFNTSQLFKCPGDGAVPEPLTNCDMGCDSMAEPDNKCIVECVCTTNTDVCGSTFDPTCGFDIDTLYGCSAVGAAPEDKETCHAGCDIASTPVHKCNPDPTCRCTGYSTVGLILKLPKACLDTLPDNTCEALAFAERCDVAVESFKTTVDGVVVPVDNFVASNPTFISDYIKPCLLDEGKAFTETVFSSIDEVAKYAAFLSSALATLTTVVQKNAAGLAELIGLPEFLLTLASSAFQLAVDPAQEVAACRGVPKNCLGIMVLLGLVIKNVVPGLRESLPGAVVFIMGGYLSELEGYGDKLIDGGMTGDKSAAQALKGYIAGVLGTVSIFAPASIMDATKVPVAILNDLLDSVDSCE
ncbi:hypothetical protein BGX33_009053 [Mortierella sp. NVP41]|nr:hypothetical protein BGX33_009053 [Mortierella sp. NVP41]